MDQGRNRVFINPNFNKRVSNNVPVGNVPAMHVNPNFYQHRQTVQPMPKPKIHINPNFVRPTGTNNHVIQHVSTFNPPHSYVRPSPLMDSSNTLTSTVSAPTRHKIQSSVHTNTANPNFNRPNRVIKQIVCVNNSCTINPYEKPTPLSDSSVTMSVPGAATTSQRVQSSILTNLVPTQPYQTHSRYSLVRPNKPGESLTNFIKPQTSTIKISKYKSIKITDVRKNLDSVKPLIKVTPFKVSNNHKSLIRTVNNQKVISKTPTKLLNRYKFVRPTVDTAKPLFKRQISSTKKLVSNRTRIKAVGVYKKNNIPCPQFRKYGKCLRKLYGTCEFLHDRKHVSICRKFLNGVCHNKDCLLSHELTDNKMPTCYFYLKGMCIKDGCPYLHVKLNEKAKICPDFIKGYCERGDKCMNRHVAKSLNVVKNRRATLKKQISQQMVMKYKLERNKVKSYTSSAQKRKSKVPPNRRCSRENNDATSRYYKESVEESSTSENLEIKPTRCKLGTLPSFIQL